LRPDYGGAGVEASSSNKGCYADRLLYGSADTPADVYLGTAGGDALTNHLGIICTPSFPTEMGDGGSTLINEYW
jgi:hypothetical protein